MTFLRTFLLLLGFSFSTLLAAANPAVALFYAANAPLAELKAFDIAVVEPDHGYNPVRYRTPNSELYAYVAVAEVQPSRAYFKEIPENWKLARNGDWGSVVLDQTQAGWPEFFAEKVIGPYWNKGYRGFFLDTMDSYRLAAKFDEAAQQDGLVRLIENLHRRYPGIRLILNRGFEIVPRVRDKIQMVAAESLFKSWNANAKRYEEVKASDREWLLGKLKTIHKRDRIPILVIDYVAPNDRKTARETAERIKALGFVPWVTDGHLNTLGIGSIEVLPRRVLIIYDSLEAPALNYANAHRFLQMPLNHLGYMVDYADANQELPKNILTDRYAGIVSWFSGSLQERAGKTLPRWLHARITEGLPIAVIGNFGFSPEQGLSRSLGLAAELSPATGTVQISKSHSMLGFETPARASRNQIPPFRLNDPSAQALIEIRDEKNQPFIGGALTPWGGFILDPYVLLEIPGTEHVKWVVDPFAFLVAALRLPALPVPDITTENGRRLFFSHIDGDGFPSLAEQAGSPPAAEVLLKEVLERYRVPTTMSVIESEVSPDGLYPKLSPKLEAIARRMFALPHVEIASHTYAHPFLWDRSVKHGKFSDAKEESYHLDIPGYKFSLDREIIGSVNYIQERLAPRGKPVKILLWSGDTAPGADALAITEQAGLLNMNGGDTFITNSNPSLTAIGAHGIQKNGLLQVYAPITNENIYTNLWRGPFYGFERVIESFELTESPRRLKPVDIYYHTYSASKRAGLSALHKAFAWAQAQELHPVFASEYIRKVQDFHDMSIAREGAGYRIRSNGNLRTLRLPESLGHPDMTSANGVAGFSSGKEGRYVHLTGSAAWFANVSREDESSPPYLYDANGRIADWQDTADSKNISFSLNAYSPLIFRLARLERCQVRANDRLITPMRSETLSQVKTHQFRLKDATAKIKISCPAG